ncbi:perlucin-like protein [Saccostrea echinata]|uniref:perlucin-like protein n=1 Tax=Saccostrea echinata TaxID=191078 RepID=UPI002A836338|nr:perlucin-like protein [Saccostrea echinata]
MGGGDLESIVTKSSLRNWTGLVHRLQKANLAGIERKEENEWLKKQKLWLDLNDLSVEGNWRWFSTGKSVSYTNWIPGQPDYASEDCGQMNYPSHKKGQWNNLSCDAKIGFICELSGMVIFARSLVWQEKGEEAVI